VLATKPVKLSVTGGEDPPHRILFSTAPKLASLVVVPEGEVPQLPANISFGTPVIEMPPLLDVVADLKSAKLTSPTVS
jgi:hypothetical protein